MKLFLNRPIGLREDVVLLVFLFLALAAILFSRAEPWMDDLRFYVLFNSISVISGRWADDNERLCAMESRLQLRRFRLERGSNSGPLDQ